MKECSNPQYLDRGALGSSKFKDDYKDSLEFVAAQDASVVLAVDLGEKRFNYQIFF